MYKHVLLQWFYKIFLGKFYAKTAQWWLLCTRDDVMGNKCRKLQHTVIAQTCFIFTAEYQVSFSILL